MAGEGGFEPPNVGSKDRCLTTWRLPSAPAGAHPKRCERAGHSPIAPTCARHTRCQQRRVAEEQAATLRDPPRWRASALPSRLSKYRPAVTASSPTGSKSRSSRTYARPTSFASAMKDTRRVQRPRSRCDQHARRCQGAWEEEVTATRRGTTFGGRICVQGLPSTHQHLSDHLLDDRQ